MAIRTHSPESYQAYQYWVSQSVKSLLERLVRLKKNKSTWFHQAAALMTVAPVGSYEVIFSLKSPPGTALSSRVPHRLRNVSDHQSISTPSSPPPPLPPHHRDASWGERGMLQEETGWIHLLHLGAGCPQTSQRASPPMPQQLRLHNGRLIKPKVLLSDRYCPLSSSVTQLEELGFLFAPRQFRLGP